MICQIEPKVLHIHEFPLLKDRITLKIGKPTITPSLKSDILFFKELR